ncbi:MAG TPA: Gfo/Idh/MocA family oxidoreductase [Acidobacteriota bacterium]|nr:Gfo/Idh/MocA family oxidoreductase [Acidobacteriota bacterium]
MLNVGIIGLGQMGSMHLTNCLHMDNIKVVGVADPSERALKRSASLGCDKVYADYKQLFDNSRNLDAVIISVPNYLHLEVIKSALENGLNVLTEKPLAINVQQCENIVKCVKSSGRKLMIGHNLRFVDAIEKIKASFEKGYIGSLETATIEEIVNGPFSHPRNPAPVAGWWLNPEKSGGGALIDIGYHMIDLFRFFTGEDSKVVFSNLRYKYNLPVEEGAIVVLSTTESSIKGIINVGWYQRSVFPKYNFRVILHGNSGYLSTEDLFPRNIYLHAFKEGSKNILRRITGQKLRPLSYTYYYEAYYKELKTFFDCLENDVEPPVSAVDGLKTMQIIEESYKLFNDRNRSD